VATSRARLPVRASENSKFTPTTQRGLDSLTPQVNGPPTVFAVGGTR
jgi:hypothetical protein